MRLTDRLAASLAASLAAVALLGGCTRAAPPSPRLVSGPLSAAAADSQWAAASQRLFVEYSDAVAAAAGLAPLRTARLRGNEREVRVWLGKYWNLPRLYRLTGRDANVAGDLLLWWPSPEPDSARPADPPGETRDDLMRFRLAGSCGDFARRPPVGLCRTQFRTAPDWAAALGAAEALGLWTMLDRPARWEHRHGFDGWLVTVELREGRRYTVRDYWSPASAQGPDQARVIALVGALEPLDSLRQPRTALRPHRGVTRGRPEDAFRPCGGGVEWAFGGMLPPPPGRSIGEMGIGGRDTLAAERYVEVVGVLSPEWDARRRGSRFSRILDVERVTKVAPWTGRECR